MEAITEFLLSNWMYVLATLASAILVLMSEELLWWEAAPVYLGIVVTIVLMLFAPVYGGIFLIGLAASLGVRWIIIYFNDRHSFIAIPNELNDGKRYTFEKMEIEGSKEWVLRPISK